MFVYCQNSLSAESVHDSPAVRISCPLIGQNSFATGAAPSLSYVTPFIINICQFCRWSVWDWAPVETPQSSLEATRHSPLEGLPLEVRGTMGCTHVLGEGIGTTEHEWGWWCFGATELLYPYRMKYGLGCSVAQNTTAISLVVEFYFSLLIQLCSVGLADERQQVDMVILMCSLFL